MQNENEKNLPAGEAGKQPDNRAQLGMTIHIPDHDSVKHSIEELSTMGHKVLIVGNGTEGKTHLLAALLAAKNGKEKDFLMDRIADLGLKQKDIPEDLLFKLKEAGLLVVVDDMSELDKMMMQRPVPTTITLTNPYQGLHQECPVYYPGNDPKKKHWDKPKFMGDAAPIGEHRSGGNNRKIKKRKKSKNGRKRK